MNLNAEILSMNQKDLQVLHRLVLTALKEVSVFAFDITLENSLYFWYAYDNKVYESDQIGSWQLNKYLRLVRNANHAIYKFKIIRNEKKKTNQDWLTNHDWLSPMEKLLSSEIEMAKLGILREMNKKLGSSHEVMMNL
jgi:hypothetical protein